MLQMYKSLKILLLIVGCITLQSNQAEAQSISFNGGTLEIFVSTANDNVVVEGNGGSIAICLNGDWFEFERVELLRLNTSDGNDTVIFGGAFDASIHVLTGNDDDFVFVTGVYRGTIFRVTESTGFSTSIRDTTGDDQVVFEDCEFENTMGFELGSGKNNVLVSSTLAYRQAVYCEYGELEATYDTCNFNNSDIRVSHAGSIDADYDQVDVADGIFFNGFHSQANPGDYLSLTGNRCSFGKFGFYGGDKVAELQLTNCQLLFKPVAEMT